MPWAVIKIATALTLLGRKCAPVEFDEQGQMVLF